MDVERLPIPGLSTGEPILVCGIVLLPCHSVLLAHQHLKLTSWLEPGTNGTVILEWRALDALYQTRLRHRRRAVIGREWDGGAPICSSHHPWQGCVERAREPTGEEAPHEVGDCIVDSRMEEPRVQ